MWTQIHGHNSGHNVNTNNSNDSTVIGGMYYPKKKNINGNVNLTQMVDCLGYPLYNKDGTFKYVSYLFFV